MPPPSKVAVLPESVLSVTSAVPLLKTPPPLTAVLPERVLSVTLVVPRLWIPPPLVALLSEKVLLLTDRLLHAYPGTPLGSDARALRAEALEKLGRGPAP